MSAPRDPTRLRQRLNPLMTSSLNAYPQQANTPLSAVSFNSNSHNGFSSNQTPQSAIQPYNPQEWISSPMAGPERGHQISPDSNASPLPPPPYSPPRSQRPTSMYFEGPSGAANISAARAPLPIINRPSPEPAGGGQSFQPPPNARGSSSSRDWRFGFPSLGRRRDPETTPSPESIGSGQRSIPLAITSRPHPLTIQIPAVIPQRTGSDASSTGLPPGARRAVSTGAIDTPTSARSRSASQGRWDPAMPLPPPPPGPPPAGSRSQSQSTSSRNVSSGSEPVMSPPTRRPPPSGVTALGPVPPTPANWVEEDQSQRQSRARASPNILPSSTETSSIDSSSVFPESAVSSSSSNAGLNRQNALRGEKSLRERRTESRTRSARQSIDASIASLENIMIPPTSGGLSRKLTIGRGTPRSAGHPQSTPRSADLAKGSSDEENSGSTPKALDSARSAQPRMEMTTPPFSPRPLKSHQLSDGPSDIAPKALPTPPPQNRSASTSKTRMTLEHVTPTPSSAKSLTRETIAKQSPGQFCQATIDRFQAFAHREATAADDAERVRLFAEFIVSESRVRRERYSMAIGAMGSEIFDLTRDLFRPMVNRRESTTSQGSEWTPMSSEPNRSHRGSLTSVFRGEGSKQGDSSSAPTSANIPVSPSGPAPNNTNWNADYRPTLSPILSMSVSDSQNERDSRGRPASRWWEADSNGESSMWERSKRESKYMGVPKEAREALQWIDTPGSVEGSSRREPSNEYPPEKQGWHEQQPEQTFTPNSMRNSLQRLPYSSPNTPNPNHLDVSRLVTLPPPYPRHHPAVNNNHPELTVIRDSIRTVSDLSEVEATKQRFTRESKTLREEAADAANKRRHSLRINLQQEVGLGNITYAEAAAMEADSNENEKHTAKELEKKDFDRFQTAVVVPLNELLTSRIVRATALFDELRGRLFVETREPSPNMPQEEGDEQPELLEKLTLLKWIFEAREVLHRAIYDLLSDRNERYREMVIKPYRLARNEDKVAHASAFFAEDAGKRRLAFATECYQRAAEFQAVVEENVVRGVEVQISAFWDIAPPLNRLLERIPVLEDMGGFNIQVPASEMLENPDYRAHPLQYLFSLLLHAEKSTYQFIESQTNLFCLLHEVKEAVVGARARVMEADGRDAGEVERMKDEEGGRLTDDLKEKVRVVQEQWRSALGEGIGHVKERVGGWLLETGGWDESLEDRGVGSL